MGLYYSNVSKYKLVGYANVGFLSDPYDGKSQISYMFTYGGAAISWRSMK